MAKTTANISIDAETKRQAQELFAEFGMDLSTAVTIFFRQAIWEHSMPFEITRQSPNEATLAAMDAAEKGEDLYGPFDNVEDLMEALNA